MIRPYLDLLRREPAVLVFGILCAFLSAPGQTFFISLFLGDVAETVGVGAAEMGSLYLLATMGAATLLPVTGPWIDRLDLRWYVAFVLVALAGACAAMAGANGPLGLLAGFLLLRLTGQGLMTHIGVTSVARYFTTRRGQALALVAVGFPLAEGILPGIAVALISAIGWRETYLAVATAVLLLAAPALVHLAGRVPAFARPPADTATSPRPRLLDGFRIVAGTRFFRCALPILLFMPFTSTALIFHIQAIAQDKGWPAGLVAFGLIAYAVGHLAGLAVSGGLVDRLGARAMLPRMNLPLLIGVAALGAFDAQAAAIVFFGLNGFSAGLVVTAVGAVWAEVYGVSRLGTIRSFAVMLMVAGTALGPATIGIPIDAGVGIGWICAGLILAGTAAALLAELERRAGP
ncbi:MAG: MFS transporter [Acetobacterales bacterium]